MPGILEEVMLALALAQPIYVVGAYRVAAFLCGQILGLSYLTDGVVKVETGDLLERDESLLSDIVLRIRSFSGQHRTQIFL